MHFYKFRNRLKKSQKQLTFLTQIEAVVPYLTSY